MFNWILWVWNGRVGVKGHLHRNQPPRQGPEGLLCGERKPERCHEVLCGAEVKFRRLLIRTSKVQGPQPLPSRLCFEHRCREMGLSHSKAHPRVTKVAPLQNKEEETPSACPVDSAFNRNLEEKSSYLLARLQDRNKALEGQLPPLRETWCGRYCAGTGNSHREAVDLGQGKLDYLSEVLTVYLYNHIRKFPNCWNVRGHLSAQGCMLVKYSEYFGMGVCAQGFLPFHTRRKKIILFQLSLQSLDRKSVV